jgi:hypothetical protein
VVTADVKGAGTDGSVTITIEGEKGCAKDLSLSNDWSTNFERGHTDVFDVTAPDVGAIKSITVKLVSNCCLLAWWFSASQYLVNQHQAACIHPANLAKGNELPLVYIALAVQIIDMSWDCCALAELWCTRWLAAGQCERHQ